MSTQSASTTQASRRQALLAGAAAIVAALPHGASGAEPEVTKVKPMSGFAVSYATKATPMLGGFSVLAKDGTTIFFRDSGGKGQPIVFSHGWPLSGNAWDSQLLYFGLLGYRVIAVDRRGHGNSGTSWEGNDLDHYGDDLATVIDILNLRNAVLVGHSTGGGEVVRYISRHGEKRIAKAVLVAAIPPLLLQTDAHPQGAPMSVFDGLRAGVSGIRSQFFRDLAIPFFGFNRSGAKPVQGLIDDFYRMGMQGDIKAEYDCIKAFSETDMTADLKKITVPTLLMHGDDDQIVPIDISARVGVKLIRNATLKVYPGAPHGMAMTMGAVINADMLAFIKS